MGVLYGCRNCDGYGLVLIFSTCGIGNRRERIRAIGGVDVMCAGRTRATSVFVRGASRGLTGAGGIHIMASSTLRRVVVLNGNTLHISSETFLRRIERTRGRVERVVGSPGRLGGGVG